MLPFHTLMFNPWIMVVDPCCLHTDDASKKIITFIFRVIQMALADISTLNLCSCDLLGNHTAQSL